jgi:hypothetical protein
MPQVLYYIILLTTPPIYKHLYANHLQPPPVRKCSAIVSSGHGSLWIIIDQLAQEPCLGKVAQPTQVDGALGVPLPRKDAALARTEGDHVARSREIQGCSRR